MENRKLPITLKDISPSTYDKPERKNELVAEKQYNEVDATVSTGVKIGSNGVVYVEENSASTLFQENKSDTEYIINTFIPEKYKRNIGGKNLIHSSAIVGLLDERAQETRSASKQALQQYSRDSLINISDSNQAQSIRRNLDDFNSKEQKKLRKSRVSEIDEVTGEQLEKGYAFHHKNQKSIYTDPERILDPEGGVLVNDATHKEIHRRKIRDDKALEEYKKELLSKRDITNTSTTDAQIARDS